MTTKSLDEIYLEWLAGQVRNQHRQKRDKTYWGLMEILHSKTFVWLIANDDNRVADGLELRREFHHEVLGDDLWHPEIDARGCSCLELIVGLSRRMEFAAGGEAEIWAWHLIDNLELGRMYDPISRSKANRIDQILEALIWRHYSPDGSGGFFPLSFPEDNQLEVEIWYQMNAYIEEMPPHY